MRINVKGTADGAVVEFVQPVDHPGTDNVLNSVEVPVGQELLVNVPTVTEPSGFEYGNVVEANGEPAAPPVPPAGGGNVGGGNEGSAQGGTTETGEGDQPSGGTAPTDPESPGPDAGNQGGQGDGLGNTSDQGSGSGDQGDQETSDGGSEGGVSTSEVSEKPLYLVDGDTVPQGFSESGLETPDGKTLFHYGTDVAGGPTTGNADGVSVYAESAENDKPVVSVVTDDNGAS